MFHLKAFMSFILYVYILQDLWTLPSFCGLFHSMLLVSNHFHLLCLNMPFSVLLFVVYMNLLYVPDAAIVLSVCAYSICPAASACITLYIENSVIFITTTVCPVALSVCSLQPRLARAILSCSDAVCGARVANIQRCG